MTVWARCFLAVFGTIMLGLTASATPITRIWLTHPTGDGATLMVNWESKTPGPSRVDYGASEALGKTASGEVPATLHHVEVPFHQEGLLHYRVETGGEQSAIHAVKSYSGDTLRIAAAANWQFRPALNALLQDDPHLLLSCGDMVIDVVPSAPGETANTKPFSNLIDIYPDLFARVPFLPALGNHDRQIRYAKAGAPPQPLYDLEAAAFRAFFPLPEDGRKYCFDLPAFSVRLVALDLSHTRNIGTPGQSSQEQARTSEQFRWYRDVVRSRTQRFMVTYYNESSPNLRAAEGGAWETLLRQGSVALSGFGSFAERSEVKGMPYFNSGLKARDESRDSIGGKYYKAAASYTLLSIPKEGETMTVELKATDGTLLDRSEWPGRSKPGNRQRIEP